MRTENFLSPRKTQPVHSTNMGKIKKAPARALTATSKVTSPSNRSCHLRCRDASQIMTNPKHPMVKPIVSLMEYPSRDCIWKYIKAAYKLAATKPNELRTCRADTY